MRQTLYAMLAVLEIIGRRQDSPASCRARKRKCKIIKIVVDFCCLLWYIISMNKTIISIEDQVSARFPNLLTEEIADIVSRTELYHETIDEAVASLIGTGVLLHAEE